MEATDTQSPDVAETQRSVSYRLGEALRSMRVAGVEVRRIRLPLATIAMLSKEQGGILYDHDAKVYLFGDVEIEEIKDDDSKQRKNVVICYPHQNWSLKVNL